MSHLREMLVRHEGLKLKPYIDTAGKLTIGVGRNLTDRGLSVDEVSMLLDNDIADAKADLKRALPWTETLDEVRHDALVSMCFNLGILRLLDFKLFLAALEAGDYPTAKKEMLNSRWAKQVGSRADELAAMILGGQ